MKTIQSINEILETKRVFFFDIYGVLRTRSGIFPGVHDLFIRLREKNIPFWFVTNDASKSPSVIAEILSGSSDETKVTADQVITSGSILSDYLQKNHRGKRVAYVGPKGCEGYITDVGCKALIFPELNNFDEIDVFALMDNDGYDWKTQLNRILNLLKQKEDLPLVVPNPDVAYPNSTGEYALASGALARMLGLAVRREFLYFGKPGKEIFETAFALAKAKIPDLNLSECLMVGDTYHIDILGAHQFGIPSLLVLSGNTKGHQVHKLAEKFNLKPNFIAQSVI